jgi:predicted phosphodiesterase
MTDLLSSVRHIMRVRPETSVDDLIERFPGADVWELRAARRDVLREHAAEALPVSSIAESTLLQRTLSKSALTALRAGFVRPVKLELRDRPRIKPIFKKGGETIMVIGDIHAPDHDPHALDVLIQIAQALGIDRLILNGDSFDVHALSKYTLAAHRPFRWVDERAEALPVLAMIREEFPETPIDFIYGNHDVRPLSFITAQAPQLQGLFDLPTLLGITDLDFRFPEGNRVILGDKVLVKHGVKVAQGAGESVKKEVIAHGMSVHMGHVHRLSFAGTTRTAQMLNGEQAIFGVEGGCVQNLRPDYLPPEETANWQQGATVYTLHDSGMVVPELVPVHSGHAYFRGMEFRSRLLSEHPGF